jgi:hypothetical protein
VTNLNDLSKTIAAELARYSQLVKEDFEEAKKDVSIDLVENLKATSPENTGDYKKGWTIKKQKDSFIVYNKTNYQLTHLLEHGHAKRNGGRVEAQVHIAPAEQQAINEFTDRIEKAIKRD